MISTKPYTGRGGGTEVTRESSPELTKFLEIAAPHAQTLIDLSREYEEKRKWNIDNHGKGKNWPIFSKREKFIDKLCKEAGIKDS